MTGERPSYQDRQKGRVQCREFGYDMAAVSMAGHTKTKHGRAEEEIWIWKTSATGEETRT